MPNKNNLEPKIELCEFYNPKDNNCTIDINGKPVYNNQKSKCNYDPTIPTDCPKYRLAKLPVIESSEY